MIPTNKELREKYPYVGNHKKNCTCFGCGSARIDMWAKDNPYAAEHAVEILRQKNKDLIAKVDEIKSDPLAAKANRNKAITGSPYYKLDGDSIHCGDCGQRLGNLCDRCPLGCEYVPYVYGKMLNNPADPRWNDPMYNKSKFNTRYRTSQGIVHEQSAAETTLKERMTKIDKPEDLT